MDSYGSKTFYYLERQNLVHKSRWNQKKEENYTGKLNKTHTYYNSSNPSGVIQ